MAAVTDEFNFAGFIGDSGAEGISGSEVDTSGAFDGFGKPELLDLAKFFAQMRRQPTASKGTATTFAGGRLGRVVGAPTGRSRGVKAPGSLFASLQAYAQGRS